MEPATAVEDDKNNNNLTAGGERISLHIRLCWELRPSAGLFDLNEPNGRIVDLAACLVGDGPARTTAAWQCKRPMIKLLLLLWSLQVLAYDVYHYPPHNLYIYFGYLTHWGHLLSICYLAASFLCSVRLQQPPTTTTTTTFVTTATDGNKLATTTWALYSLTAPLELAICLLYWSAIAAGPSAFSYTSLMEHGGIAVMVWWDGAGLIPVRAKQVVFLMTVCGVYLLWTGVDAVLGIGNGEWGPAYNDDALYPVLNWNSDSQTAATVSAVAICIVAPACFGVCWMSSLVSCRHDGGSAKEGEESGSIDTSSAFCSSRWCCCCRCKSSSVVFDGSRRPLLPLAVGEEVPGSNCYNKMGDSRIV